MDELRESQSNCTTQPTIPLRRINYCQSKMRMYKKCLSGAAAAEACHEVCHSSTLHLLVSDTEYNFKSTGM